MSWIKGQAQRTEPINNDDSTFSLDAVRYAAGKDMVTVNIGRSNVNCRQIMTRQAMLRHFNLDLDNTPELKSNAEPVIKMMHMPHSRYAVLAFSEETKDPVT